MIRKRSQAVVRCTLVGLFAAGIWFGADQAPQARGDNEMSMEISTASVEPRRFEAKGELAEGGCDSLSPDIALVGPGDLRQYSLGYEAYVWGPNVLKGPDLELCGHYHLADRLLVTFSLSRLERYQGITVNSAQLQFTSNGTRASTIHQEPFNFTHCVGEVLLADIGVFTSIPVYRVAVAGDVRETSSARWSTNVQPAVQDWADGSRGNHGLILAPFDEPEAQPDTQCHTYLSEFQLDISFTYTDLAPIEDVSEALEPGVRIGPQGGPTRTPPPRPLPDLVVSSVQVRGRDVTTGNECRRGENRVLAVVRNTGGQTAGPFAVRLQVDGKDEGIENIASLDGGRETVALFDKVDLKRGERILRLIADTNLQVTESNETNNVLETRVQCERRQGFAPEDDAEDDDD